MQEYWSGKIQGCTTQKNNNGGSNGSDSVSLRGAADKEESRPEYQTQDIRIGGGVLTVHIGYGISEADRGSSDSWQPPWRGGKGGS